MERSYFLPSCILMTIFFIFTDIKSENFDQIYYTSIISMESGRTKAVGILKSEAKMGHDHNWKKNSSNDILLPSLVTLLDVRYKAPRPFCGGVIIDKEWVLTTAFCLAAYQPKNILVNTCEVALTSLLGNHRLTRGKKIIIHERYNSFSRVNDIALLKVSPFFNFTSMVSPAELCCESSYRKQRDELCKVYGWNMQHMVVNFFKEILLKVMPKYQCKKMYPNLISRSMFCGITQDADTPCLSNWGTPLICGEDLVGLTSWTNGCPKHQFPTVFVSICRYLKWINRYIKKV